MDYFLDGHPGQGGVFPLNDAVLENAQLALQLQAQMDTHSNFITILSNISKNAADTAAGIIFPIKT
jgi:hypothetical protein